MLIEYCRISKEMDKIKVLLSNEKFLIKASGDIISLNKKKLTDYNVLKSAVFSDIKNFLLKRNDYKGIDNGITKEDRLFWDIQYMRDINMEPTYGKEWFSIYENKVVSDEEYIRLYEYLKTNANLH